MSAQQSGNNNGNGGQVDLNSSEWSNHRKTLSVEPDEKPEEMASRLRKDEAQERMKRGMTIALFIFALVVIGTVFAIGAYTVVEGTADDKKLAIPLLTLIVSGLVGFLVGKATAK